MHVAEELILPCQPRVLALLMRELLTDIPNMRRLHQLFGCDPVLAALLMECSNSNAFQLGGQVRGIPQALVLLNERQLRTLLKKAQAGMTGRPVTGVDMAQFARLSHATAKLARSLAGLTGLESCTSYMAALLHGMGQVILHHTQPERMLLLDKEVGIWDPRRAKLEYKHWGYSANSTSAALLRQWNLPADVVAAVKNMEAPLAAEQFNPMAGVLHLAAWVTRVKHSGWTERAMADAFPVDVALALGIDVDVVLQQEAIDWQQSLY